MVAIDIRKANKVSGEWGMFLSFPYDEQLLGVIRALPSRYWHGETKEWEVPLNKLAELVDSMSNYEIQLTGELNALMEKKVPDIKFDFKTQPFDHQIEGFNYGLTHEKWLLGDSMGLGKALALDTKVFTPNGYKTMRDIKVGDYVFGRNGKPTKVTATYNHTNVEMYRITFSDGASVECCKDHLWKIYDTGGSKIVDTNWFMQKDQFGTIRKDNLKGGNHYKFWIDRCKPIEFMPQKIDLDPYVLGALIGDGTITKGVGLTTADEEIIDEINKRLPLGYYLYQSKSMGKLDYRIVSKNTSTARSSTYYVDGKYIGSLDNAIDFVINNNLSKTSNRQNIYSQIYPKSIENNDFRYGHHWSIERPKTRKMHTVKVILEGLNLLGTNSHTKFIPDVYKYNSIDVRKSVLQGLLDTDGYATRDNLIQFTTVSKQLCEDVRFLVESLGGLVSFSQKKCGYTTNGSKKITGIAYTLTIKFDEPQEYFKLTRKKNLLHSRKFKPHRSIVAVEKIDNADAKCITVDNDEHLYVIEHFIVTHNTKQILDIAVAKKQLNNYRHCLVICGINGLKWNWIKEIKTHTNEEGYILGQRVNSREKTVIGSNGDKLKDILRIEELPYFIVTNVESFRDEKIVGALKGLCDNGTIGMIAFDECHVAKNPNSQQGKGILKLSAENMIAMTGTPLLNTPLDLYIILKWLGYEKHSFYSFKNHYCVMGGYGGYQIVGYQHQNELKEQLDEIMLRRLKEDVLDLPEKVYVDEYVDMSKEQEKIYDEILNDLRLNVDKIASTPNPLSQLIRLRQATGYTGILSTDVQVSAKLDHMEELVEEAVANGKKVVIFSNWTQITDEAYRRLSKKYNGIVITGTTKDSERQSYVNDFQTNSAVKFALGTIGAMGTGIDLYAGTIEIFLDIPWTMGVYQQAVDRCHRIGQKNNVTIYNLICKNTIDERIQEIVNKKGQLSDSLIDGNAVEDKRELLNYLLS